MEYRMGLDVGTNSLGWSVLELNESDEPFRIEAANSRIFTDGRNPKSKATLTATRTEARSARRRRDRFKQRQKFLLAELTKAGLFPGDKHERKQLQLLNPLELRAKALKETLPLHHIGRALFHLNQHRGFNSNRKDRSEEKVSGKVSKSSRALLEEMGLIDAPLSDDAYKALSREEKKAARQTEAGARKVALATLNKQTDLTYGAFLWQRQVDGKQTRARPSGEADKPYNVYPTRELYEDEYCKIWAKQAQYHSQMTTAWSDRIHHVIYTQRPLKPQKRGQCTYLPSEKRTFRAMPGFQRYRIYQDVNNLEWTTATGKYRLADFPTVRDEIISLLEKPSLKAKPTNKNSTLTFIKMKNVVKQHNLSTGDVVFNFETAKRTGFDGNQTSNVMQHDDYVGPTWHDWSLDKQDRFIETILDDSKTDDEARDEIKKYGLTDAAAEYCLNAPLVAGTAHVSLHAARLMMAVMRAGTEQVNHQTGEITTPLPIQSEAAEYLADSEDSPDFINPMRTSGESRPLWDHLPYYGKAFQDGRHIIRGDRAREDKHDERKYYGGVTNPTVHIALNQIRQVVNELIDRYGRPASIGIELGRELPKGAEGRREIEREQKENQDKNIELDMKLLDLKQKANPDNRLRLRLWEELSKDPAGRCCPFSGEKIGITNLFDGSTNIEHLIPFSDSLDDSRANKVICTRQANRDKGQRTPFAAFGHSPEGYDWEHIFDRVQVLSKSKQWRFQKDAPEIWQRKEGDFLARHLNDTRYIGRLTREYLECICHIDKIDVVTGRLTALLRGHWGLNSVLADQPNDIAPKKNRDDHRHHAVDAIVIGMTNRSMLQKVAKAAKEAEKHALDRLFIKGENQRSPIDPWVGFRKEVAEVVTGIVPSHRVRSKKIPPERTTDGQLHRRTTDGQLHNDSAYGIVSHPDKKGKDKGKYELTIRKPIEKYVTQEEVNKIRDRQLRRDFKEAFNKAVAEGRKGVDGIKDMAQKLGIRRLQKIEKMKGIPIHNTSGKPYKVYKSDSNWGMEIYAYPEKHKQADKWHPVTISRFDANQSVFKPGQTFRPHPAARLIMRLQINNYIEIELNGTLTIYRVQLISGPRLTLAPPKEANVDARNRNKDDPFRYLSISANKLKSLNARKLHISPTGLISRENRQAAIK